MTAVLGTSLGLGLLLLVSPLLWPTPLGLPVPRGRVWRDRMARAGLPQTSPALLAGVAATVGAVAAALAFAIVPVLGIALVAGLGGGLLPFLIVARRASSRLRIARTAWPDAVDQLLSGIRSGLSLPDSVIGLGRNGPAATRQAFLEFEADYRATGSFSGSLDRLKARLADPVADRILETVRMSREVGGTELPQVLRSLSSYLREDLAVCAEVEARQGWVVNAARLGLAAPWAILVLLASRPEAAAAYNSPGGTVLIVVGLVVSVVAYRLMIRIGRLPEEGRWFR